MRLLSARRSALTAPFRAHGVLRTLNVTAVGLALAAVTSATFMLVVGEKSVEIVLAIALPTWVLGTVWAGLLRWRRTVGQSSFRFGWAASVPLAMLTAGLASGLADLALVRSDFGFVSAFFVGAVAGAICWMPALAATFLCFGLPIAWAQRLASKGLAGEERGEWMVGLAALAVSVVGLVVAITLSTPFHTAWHDDGRLVPGLLGLLGALLGGAATTVAFVREARRRRFVADVEAARIPGFRVDATDEGKVLVRILAQGEGYRVADVEEALFELDAQGSATHPMRAVATR